MFVAYAGLIGLGKTTYSEITAKELEIKLKRERVGENNPHLPPFYEDIFGKVKPSKHAFDLQMFNLEISAEDHGELQESN